MFVKCLHVVTACAVLTSDGIMEALKIAEMGPNQVELVASSGEGRCEAGEEARPSCRTGAR